MLRLAPSRRECKNIFGEYTSFLVNIGIYMRKKTMSHLPSIKKKYSTNYIRVSNAIDCDFRD